MQMIICLFRMVKIIKMPHLLKEEEERKSNIKQLKALVDKLKIGNKKRTIKKLKEEQ